MCIIKDINPIAKQHYLAFLRRNDFERFDELADEKHKEAMWHLINKSAAFAKKHMPDGYRIVINNGKDARQTVEHLHIHIIGGEELGWSKCAN